MALALPPPLASLLATRRALQTSSLTSCQLAIQNAVCLPPPPPPPPSPLGRGVCGEGTVFNDVTEQCEISCGRRSLEAPLEAPRAAYEQPASQILAALLKEVGSRAIALAAHLAERPEDAAQMAPELEYLSAQLFWQPALAHGERAPASYHRPPTGSLH